MIKTVTICLLSEGVARYRLSKSCMIKPVIYAATLDPNATVTSDLRKKASKRAATNPTAAVTKLPVDSKIAGMTIALRME